MGIRGLYSAIKMYAIPVNIKDENESLTIGIDTYALFYKYKENLQELFTFVDTLCKNNTKTHTAIFMMDGAPPIEKQLELQLRKKQKRDAFEQATALRTFLQEPEANDLTADARQILENKIKYHENEAWTVYKELRERFVSMAKEKGYEVRFSKGEADTDLIGMARTNEIQVVLGNDMDYFVGGVERLWILMKDVPTLQEFRYSAISRQVGVQKDAWKDIAILSGYEKTPQLRRVPATHAISLLRFYGKLEFVLQKRVELLQGNTVDEFLAGRLLFA